MEISLLQALLKSITVFISLNSHGNISFELVERYFQTAEGIFKLLKPVLEATVDSDIATEERLKMNFVEMRQSVDELSGLFQSWNRLSSNANFVLQMETLILKMKTSCLDFLEMLKLCDKDLPDEMKPSSLEYFSDKIKSMGQERASSVIQDAVHGQIGGIVPSQDILVNISDILCLKSNQEILIEAAALETLKENTEQSETAFLDGLISVVTHIHDHFLLLKRTQASSPVHIPADFCCPLSLELMMDPVIVSSGQTYERVFIKSWIDLGLKVCPKTRQPLAHTTLIPNFTVKALIANWCETNNVKPPDPKISISKNHVQKDLDHSQSRSTIEVSTSVVEPEPIRHPSVLHSGENDGVPGQGLARNSSGSTALNSSQRGFEVPSRLGSSIFRRKSERIFPRIVCFAPSEARAENAEIETKVLSLIHDLQSSSIEAQKAAVSELRLLSKHNTDNRVIIARCGAIEFLVKLLKSEDPMIQQDAVTALLNLSINDNNKTAIVNAGAIPLLIHVLETGSPEAKENSAATLFSLSVMDDHKIKIGRSGAIAPLVDLLGNGTLRGKKDAATALYNLSIFHENKARIVQAGAVRHLVHLMDPAAGMVDKAVAVLSILATIPEGRNQINKENGIPVLVEVVELGSARGKENASAALLQLCTTSSRCCNLVLQEGAVPPLVALSQSGTPRAKEKAQALLSYFRSQRHGNGGRT